MEAKREYQNGAVKLPANVKPAHYGVEQSLLEDVGPDDQAHMALVITYCATTIGRKSDNIEIYIIPARHEETKEVMLYTLYVGLPMKTVIEDEQLFYLRSISEGRIDRPITYEPDLKATPMCMKLRICINPLKYMAEFDHATVTNIYIKRHHRVNYLHDKIGAADDDKRGSTKRTRRDADIDK